jgi:phosphoglycerol transferase MdoB-like AlkP superfamily enzyme
MIIQKYKLVIKQVIALLGLYFITRLFFLLFNFSYFNASDNLLTPFFYGLRFDLVVICWTNGLIFIISLLPFKFTDHYVFKSIYRIIFVLVNAFALLFNCIDIGYFEFIQKRSTFDLFQTLSGENDGMQLLPQYIADYWHVLIIWIAVIITLIIFSKSEQNQTTIWNNKKKWGHFMSIIIVFLPLLVIGSRGGWQYRPLDMIGASNYAKGKQVALVLNSPFCIMKSATKAQLEKVQYFDEKHLKQLYNTSHYKTDTFSFQQKNVVIIILESVGSEYTGLANDHASLTPFLDSLSERSTFFVNAFANGKTSIKGIPAIVAGIPTLFDGSFTYSSYNANTFESIASLLKKKGYKSSFFHGGNNGTMGFDVFAKAAGFDAYYGRNEHPNQEDYDGYWGIFDEPFYQFFKSKLDQEQAPFVSCFFSLSSHHPYTIPEKYKNKFKGNSLAISKSVQYADYALQQFFNEAKKSNWYKNTVFVITADHTSMSKNPKYQTDIGIYSIPILIFEPNVAIGTEVKSTIQQIDIMPSILKKLNYDLPYFAYGNTYSSQTIKHAVSYNGQYYQLISDKYCLQFDGEKTIAVYDLKVDPMIKKNLIHHHKTNYKNEENLLKAIIQTYNQSMIENKMN